MKKAKRRKKVFIVATISVIIGLAILVLMFGKSEKVEVKNIPVIESEVPSEATSTVKMFQYIYVHDGCDWNGVGTCVNMRSGAGTEYPVVTQLRNGVVLKVKDSIVVNGRTWYRILFDSWTRYPERLSGNLYVADTDSVELFTDVGNQEVSRVNASSTKRIVVDISEQMVYAFDGDSIFMKEPASTGLKDTPTPRGTFFIFRKTPSRYMQGPIPEVSDQYYDLPGVPWDLYFTQGGAVIHGAYWHDQFSKPWSHGCVNLPVDIAKKLYQWADVGIPVVVQN
jgi:hypothetical protein